MTPGANGISSEKKKNIVVLGAGERPLCDRTHPRTDHVDGIRRSGFDYCIEDSTTGELYGYCGIGDITERSKLNQIYQQMGCELHLTTD